MEVLGRRMVGPPPRSRTGWRGAEGERASRGKRLGGGGRAARRWSGAKANEAMSCIATVAAAQRSRAASRSSKPASTAWQGRAGRAPRVGSRDAVSCARAPSPPRCVRARRATRLVRPALRGPVVYTFHLGKYRPDRRASMPRSIRALPAGRRVAWRVERARTADSLPAPSQSAVLIEPARWAHTVVAATP